MILLDQMRIGHVRPGHADHVELAAGDRMPGRGNIGNAGGVERRQSNLGADAAGEIEMRCGLHALHRDDVGHRRIGVDLAADDIEKIDLARRLEHVADGNAFFFVDPARLAVSSAV
jgi:hypothetical protein